jgi:hypothetical protein
MIVIMGPPDDVKDRKISRLANPLENRARVRYGAPDHLAHQSVRWIGGERSPAIGGELLKIEHLGPSNQE